MDTINLFSPYNLGGIQLQNRMVMAPMTRCRSDNEENVATNLTAEYYAQRASAGLIITEGTYVSNMGIGYINVPAIYTKAQINGWKLVTSAVQDKGGKIFAQLWHVGSLSHPDLHNGIIPLAPSAVNPNSQAYTKDGFINTVTPREMSVQDIKETISDFRQAAINALEAGFDGVEVHAANGYLFHQFFNLFSNKRTDQYGGTIENRARFLFETLDEMKTVINMDRVGVRLNPSLHNLLGMFLDEETSAVFEYIVKRLNDYGLAYLHLTEPYTAVDNEPFAIKHVAKHFRPLFNGTIIINSAFDKGTGNKVLQIGDADLVAYGTPFLANPDLVKRYQNDAPLNTPDKNTFYTTGAEGYTDYAFLKP